MTADLETRPVGPGDLADLAELFDDDPNTRRCWSTAFCSTRLQFATGWMTNGNKARFEAIATSSTAPMGVLAASSGQPVGWAACGPRSRYAVAEAGRSNILRSRDRSEDDVVWLLACLFVRVDHRSRGVTHALVQAAVEQARTHGALAIEGWPLTGSSRRAADAFVGREPLFDELGFSRVGAPAPGRVTMRLELSAPGTPERR